MHWGRPTDGGSGGGFSLPQCTWHRIKMRSQRDTIRTPAALCPGAAHGHRIDYGRHPAQISQSNCPRRCEATLRKSVGGRVRESTKPVCRFVGVLDPRVSRMTGALGVSHTGGRESSHRDFSTGANFAPGVSRIPFISWYTSHTLRIPPRPHLQRKWQEQWNTHCCPQIMR